MNFADVGMVGSVGIPIRRWGGNRTSRYNWQFDVDNTANDYFFQNIAAGNGVNLPNDSSANQFVISTKLYGGELSLEPSPLGGLRGAYVYGDYCEAQLYALVPKGATVLVASGFDAPGDTFDAAVMALSRRTTVAALVILDAFERHPPKGAFDYQAPDGRFGRGGAGTAYDPATDPRILRLAGLGVTAIPVGADEAPEAVAGRLEALDGRR